MSCAGGGTPPLGGGHKVKHTQDTPTQVQKESHADSREVQRRDDTEAGQDSTDLNGGTDLK